ncbi:unnamed protein product [Cyprideis torosa]|uniref:Mitochondrial import receptor subunit TOM22 homolog n=1 Tax=Cyprideis torosa TaxID=163714 RepID=A0A7R8WNW0_9CRUS|nr:unnamed protein product [Cyprideis torosa]CAG0906666.1 unnamed protein product [Cyprideis torosa]
MAEEASEASGAGDASNSKAIVSSEEDKVRPLSEEVDDAEDDEDLEETLYERFIGLGEMFPESVRSRFFSLLSFSAASTKSLYTFTRAATFASFTSALILFMPVAFELERAQLEDMQKKQMLLGPAAGLGPMPPGGPLPKGLVGGPPLPPK